MTDSPQPIMQGWRIDKHVPLALIVTILLQTAVAIWWAAGIDYRVSRLEREAISASDQLGRIIRLETKVEAANETLSSIDDKIDRALIRISR